MWESVYGGGTSMYDTILVPTDGSEHAVRAAEHGLYLARTFDATVHVVNVVDVQAAAGPFGAGGVDEEYIRRLEAEGERTIETVEAVVEATDAVETAVVRGRPSEAILDYVDEHGVDLVAMGTHGRTGVERYVAGSVTERVVRLAEVPVLTVRAVERSRVGDGYDEVLVPTDGSEAAAAAVEHAVAVAARTGARLHAVNVVDVGRFAAGPDYNPPLELMRYLEDAGETATERVAERARDAGVDAVTAVREGTPARELLDYADENDVDLVAMATAGRTGLSRYLLGSTTERVVRHAEVPVLAVDAGEDDESTEE
jgi:nucleotide-binding universal stress UspA family protein